MYSTPRNVSVSQESLEHLIQIDSRIRRLYKEHKSLDQKISELEGRNFLSPTEQIEIKNLKKKKLRSKDKLMKMLEGYRNAEAGQAA